MPAKVVLDSNVLYSARLRDLWMELGVAGLVSLVWTERIEDVSARASSPTEERVPATRS
jgi:hypothetical protein